MIGKISLLRVYTKSVLVFSVLVLLLYVGVLGYLGWRVAVPTVTSLEHFTYDLATYRPLHLPLTDEKRAEFEVLTPEVFEANREYYWRVALTAQEEELPKKLYRGLAYAMVYVLVFFIHLGLWHKIRHFSTDT